MGYRLRNHNRNNDVIIKNLKITVKDWKSIKTYMVKIRITNEVWQRSSAAETKTLNFTPYITAFVRKQACWPISTSGLNTNRLATVTKEFLAIKK